MLKSVLSLMKLPVVDPLCFKLFPTQVLNSRCLHLTSAQHKNTPKEMIRRLRTKDEGSEGEKVIDVDEIIMKHDLFPDMHTPNRLFDGIPFKNIPVLNIKCSKNNTIMNLVINNDDTVAHHSCGCEGFMHAKRATNIAAQATALTMAQKTLNAGVKTVRVRVRGIGPGRMSGIKGLQMGGLNIISITDNTRVCWRPLRPKKQRRV